MISSNVSKSSALPRAGSAQTSSSLKSGAISAIRQRRDSCSLFGSLMPIWIVASIVSKSDHAVVPGSICSRPISSHALNASPSIAWAVDAPELNPFLLNMLDRVRANERGRVD